MDKSTAQIVAQARALRTLCAELAHGAAREAFVARLDEEIAMLGTEAVRLVIVPLDKPCDAATAAMLHELCGAPADATVSLLALARAGRLDCGAGIECRALAAIDGIERIHILVDPARVFASPLLLGRVIEHCDVVVLAGRGDKAPPAWVGAIRRLGDAGRLALRIAAPPDDPLAAQIEGAFREVRACTREPADASWSATLVRLLPRELRAPLAADASAARLALCADLLNKHVQAEATLLKFRVADLARVRRGEDAAEPGGDPREQAEMLKRTLQEWTDACRSDLARSAETGVLPFDPRMLANRLTIEDLLHREEKSAAVIKYPILGSPVLHPLVTHHFTVLADPAAVDRIRENLVTAMRTQVHKDVAALNQRVQDLVTRLRSNLLLYPSFANALRDLRVPTLAPTAAEQPVESVTLESEAEDKFVRVGFFKRLMEGRMVASMAFSFLTMSAGVFVLFGDPSIKRGLMKFSGVIVIMMVLYFIFSLLVKGEEEKQELEEVLERVRARLNQDVMRPLSKTQAAILKMYGAFVDDVAQRVLEAVEYVARIKGVERARVVEQRKSEDEAIKGFVARRQPAALAAAQKTAAFATALERARTEAAKPAAAAPVAVRTAVSLGPAAGTASATGRPPSDGGTASSLAERASLARAQALERVAALTASAAKPMTASERLAAAKARIAGSAPNPGAPGVAAVAPGNGAPPCVESGAAAPVAMANGPTGGASSPVAPALPASPTTAPVPAAD
jgi:hypothetical protein